MGDANNAERNKTERIVEARLALKQRFERRMAETPSVADSRPQGSGAANRHGMPAIPVGQTETKKWPVLDLGIQPSIPRSEWHLELLGAVDHRTSLSFDDLLALPQIDDVSDFHCVTAWSRLNLAWRGVRFSELAALAGPSPKVEHVMCHAYDGYTTNVRLVEMMKPDVLLVYQVDGQPLPQEHGGPVRVITPQLYAWKGAKWVSKIEFLEQHRLGFWEQRGYSDTAYPWRNDRYS